MNATNTGTLLENSAIKYLQQHNVLLLHRNFRTKVGEVDLIGVDKNTLTFVEVRYRKDDSHGSAAETVDSFKQQKIIRTAEFFLQTRNWAQKIPCRFDVMAISGPLESLNIEWIKDAFNA